MFGTVADSGGGANLSPALEAALAAAAAVLRLK